MREPRVLVLLAAFHHDEAAVVTRDRPHQPAHVQGGNAASMVIMPKPVSQLRLFLEGVVNGSAVQFPDELRRLAARVLRRPARHADVDDLVSEFLVRLIEATRRDQGRSAVHLLKLADMEISSAILHRLKQVVAETSPGARLRKQLRAAVRIAMHADTIPPPSAPPTSLFRDDKFSSARVRDAVAWLLAQEDRPAATVNEISTALHTMYFGQRQTTQEPSQPSPEAELVRALDGPRLRHEVRRELGEDLARVVAMRANGAELKVIAADQKVAISTAHQRLATAVQRIKRHTKRRGIAPTSLESILTGLSF